MDRQIEAVFENGVFRPLQPVDLPEQHRVTLSLSEPEREVHVVKNGWHAEEVEMDQEVDYLPLPLQDCQTIHVNFKHAGDYGPVPYPIEDDDALDEPEHS